MYHQYSEGDGHQSQDSSKHLWAQPALMFSLTNTQSWAEESAASPAGEIKLQALERRMGRGRGSGTPCVGKALDPEFPPSLDEVGSQQNYSAGRRGAVAWTPCASLVAHRARWGGKLGGRDTGNRPRGQPQARKDKGVLGRGSTQQKGHLWQVQPCSPRPARGILEPERVKERAAAQGPRRSGLGLLPPPRELSCDHCAPRSAPPPPGGFLGCLEPMDAGVVPIAGGSSASKPPLCPSLGKSLDLFMPQFPGL